jgi:DNA-binding transcriptional LysR family regulator
LHRERPDLRVELRELVVGRADVVLTGDVDVAVAYFPEALPRGLAAREVATLRPFLVLPAHSPLARRATIALRDIAGETFVTYRPGTVHHDLQMQAFARARVTPARTLAAGSAEAILGLVAAGVGCSLVPSVDAHALRARGVVARPFTMGRARFPVLAVWRAGTPQLPAIEAALAVLKAPAPPRMGR